VITSQEQLAKVTEIVSGLDAHLLDAKAENRRQRPRLKIRIAMSLILLGGTAPSPVDIFTRNISLSGMGFVCRRMFRKGERIVVPLKIPAISPKMVLAQITFSRYIGGGFYEMGAEFLECAQDARAASKGCIPNHWLSNAIVGKAPNTALPAAASPVSSAKTAK
jgi:hypothetical protein